eukprot:5534315-Amphidinium_carterae.1
MLASGWLTVLPMRSALPKGGISMIDKRSVPHTICFVKAHSSVFCHGLELYELSAFSWGGRSHQTSSNRCTKPIYNVKSRMSRFKVAFNPKCGEAVRGSHGFCLVAQTTKTIARLMPWRYPSLGIFHSVWGCKLNDGIGR